MIKKSLIDKYKNYKKQRYLNSASKYKSKFAFIGVGNHSINNLYPCLDYLGISLKYICTKHLNNATKMAQKYKETIGTGKIETIINDDEVKGVFICSSPGSHFDLARKFLSNGKSVFVEKPPCLTLKELEELTGLTQKNGQVCSVGLQKRYATVYTILKNQLKDHQNSYNFRYVTGPYPEGDVILDLFIHPIDLIIFLFGEIKSMSIKAIKNQKNLTLFLLLEHKNETLGSLELSTAYTWDKAAEDLIVNTPKGFFETKGMNKLTYTSKPPNIMGVPLEKILSLNQKQEVLFNNTGFVPLDRYNQIYTHGFFNEIQCFADAAENRKNNIVTAPEDIIATYKLIEEIKRNFA